MTRRLISYSEADSFNQCEKKHEYAHEDKLTAITHSDGLTLGTTGHLFFEVFFKAILNGASDFEAKEEATHAIAGEALGAKALNLLLPWVDGIWPTLGWKIVAVEQEYRVTISDTLVYPMKMDLLVQLNGELVLVDHKFLYDPYSREVIDILPQMPLYIGALRSHGINVKYGLYNIIRTRNTKIDLYTTEVLKPTATRVKQAMAEQIETMKRIEQGVSFRVRTANKMNCGNCQFNSLCATELRGEDTTLLRTHYFKPNTYGYEDI
jgi:CRISPR/Cas system-associated exonuclease Cas4 (RecB family)